MDPDPDFSDPIRIHFSLIRTPNSDKKTRIRNTTEKVFTSSWRRWAYSWCGCRARPGYHQWRRSSHRAAAPPRRRWHCQSCQSSVGHRCSAGRGCPWRWRGSCWAQSSWSWNRRRCARWGPGSRSWPPPPGWREPRLWGRQKRRPPPLPPHQTQSPASRGLGERRWRLLCPGWRRWTCPGISQPEIKKKTK